LFHIFGGLWQEALKLCGCKTDFPFINFTEKEMRALTAQAGKRQLMAPGGPFRPENDNSWAEGSSKPNFDF
jgi:hypothetical protein